MEAVGNGGMGVGAVGRWAGTSVVAFERTAFWILPISSVRLGMAPIMPQLACMSHGREKTFTGPPATNALGPRRSLSRERGLRARYDNRSSTTAGRKATEGSCEAYLRDGVAPPYG